MARSSVNRKTGNGTAAGFTLIELLVVVAIIALLISILLPSLNAARANAKAAKCGSNLAQVGKAVHSYLAESKSEFPLAYYYASDSAGGYDINNQSTTHAFGYVHWSYQLFGGKGEVQDQLFQCPMMEAGGHPRTNPGDEPADWIDSEQVDDQGHGRPAGGGSGFVRDRQARWMAYVPNAALMPRNKLGNILPSSTGTRRNKFVRETEVESIGKTILATEWNKNWKAVSNNAGGDGFLVKAHRAIHPFYNQTGAYDEYNAGADTLRAPFQYFQDPTDKTYGLVSAERADEAAQMTDTWRARPCFRR
ncbi:MAG: prepilin-type N-terminal cleavage/methylation domain-containing protein [Planctomycetes bacterium]|nr:prepilin-type N-terminal cleavage/methylation domain-containing protein [Planctomycetota bacterium]